MINCLGDIKVMKLMLFLLFFVSFSCSMERAHEIRQRAVRKVRKLNDGDPQDSRTYFQKEYEEDRAALMFCACKICSCLACCCGSLLGGLICLRTFS